MTSNYSFSRSSNHSNQPPFTLSTPDTTLPRNRSSLNTQYQLMPEFFNFQPTPSFSYSFDPELSSSQDEDWLMFQGQNYNSSSTEFQQKSHGHQRTASESTVNTAGPSSPYLQTNSLPYIANSGQSPSALYYSDEQVFNNVGYVPSKLSHTSAAHLAMQSMGIDHHNSSLNDDIPDFAHSSRHSISSKGQESPSTPQPRSSSDHEERPALFKVPTNEYKSMGPRVELNRTESAAFADELYNPLNNDTSTLPLPSSASNNLLSPHRNLIDERLQTANNIRSQSPGQGTSGDRSPFRRGSPFAPPAANVQKFKSPAPFLATAADSRRQQREEASAREWATHQPKLRREATKTMSPKDALLDFTDDGSDMPLFGDPLPSGYNYANMAAPQQNVGGFKASAEQPPVNPQNFNFIAPQQPASLPPNPYAFRPGNFNAENTPDFPAHLTNMESSVSEGPPASSQGSVGIPSIPRPQHTTADSGSYACPSPGCINRFDSAVKLQKHKRDAHPNTRNSVSSNPTTASSPDDRSVSPAEGIDHLGSTMTAAALAERNSQTGPHKCTRTNPSTGKPCNSIFSRPYDLTRHEDTIHNRQKQKVRCQYCREEKTFSRADALTRHMRVVHPDVDFHPKRGRKGDQF